MATKKKTPAKKAVSSNKPKEKKPEPPRTPRLTGSGSYSTSSKSTARSYVGGGAGSGMAGSTPRGGGGLPNRGK